MPEKKERRNQKLKILYLLKILMENTDETHDITLAEILKKLESYDVTAERKSIYRDIEQLRYFGIEIEGEQRDRTYYYRVVSRNFELAELKLLVDSVQSAKFITEKKSNELIKKIESWASKYEASMLQRQVYVAGRVKTMNEKIFYSVDTIHEAIGSNKKITFKYFNWTVNKTMELRHDGQKYVMSPLTLTWDDENYYLIAYDSEYDMIKHFRVDKMVEVAIKDEPREGLERFKNFNMPDYSRKMFGMFDGEEEYVKLKCENRLAGVMIDRFGKDIPIIKLDDEYFTVRVKVACSPQFLSWVISLGSGVKIEGPDRVVDQMREMIARLTEQYSSI